MHNWIAHIKNHRAFFLLFLGFLILGLSIYKDYGISTDEGTQRIIATKNIRYVTGESDELLTFQDRDYGVAFEAPLLILEYSLFKNDYHKIYPFRHLMIHLFFLFGAFIFYFLAYEVFKNKWLALIAFSLFIIHPRIFAHSFFNSKDIPFMVMLIVVMYSALKAFSNKKKRWFILFGIASAILVNLRIVGALYPVLFIYFFIYNEKKNITSALKNVSISAIVGAIILYVIWPFLWKNPIENFIQVIENMSKFRWEGDKNFLFGEYISARNLPWYYLPVWIGITTPIIVLILFVIGMTSFYKNNAVLLTTVALLTPVLAAILNNSVLYDGWRHFYFIYPLMVIITVNGISFLRQKINEKYVYAFVGISMLPVVYFSIKNHPFQQVYFNELVSKKENHLLRNFERDYWGASFYQGLKKLKIVSGEEDTIVYHSNIRVGEMNRLRFHPNKKPFLKYVSTLDSANYFITNYRWHPQEYEFEHKLFDIRVQNSPIITAWKIK
ncbi:MAG: ArnT family glycosyltransferase [Bacteroidia bacterium]